MTDARGPEGKAGRGGSDNKYFVYDVALTLNPEFKVFQFMFPHVSGSAASSGGGASKGGKGGGRGGKAAATSNGGALARQAPMKILLSPSKRLLLLHGAMYKGQSSLLVYRLRTSCQCFRLVTPG